MSVKLNIFCTLVDIFYGEDHPLGLNIFCNFFIQGFLICQLTSAELQPVNRYFTAENPEPQPDLECVVGVQSAAATEMYRVKCSDAWNISVKYDRKKANSLAADRHISEHDRRLRIIRLANTYF